MEEIKEVVKTPLTPEMTKSEDPVTETQQTETKVLSGDKTPPNLLLKSLQEERAKVKALEVEIENIKSTFSAEEIFSDEGKALKGYISKLQDKISVLSDEAVKRDLLSEHPVLKEAWTDFEEFRNHPDNAGMKLKTAAKAFLNEKGLLETDIKTRPALERSTGGPKTAPSDGTMTADDVKNMRLNNPKKYFEMVKKGQVKIRE